MQRSCFSMEGPLCVLSPSPEMWPYLLKTRPSQLGKPVVDNGGHTSTAAWADVMARWTWGPHQFQYPATAGPVICKKQNTNKIHGSV